MTTLYQAQSGIMADLRKLFAGLADRLRGIVTRYADSDGAIPVRSEPELLKAVNDALGKVFVGADGRHAFAGKSNQPMAEFPTLVNRWLAAALQGVTDTHAHAIKNAVAPAVYEWLRQAQPTPIPNYDAPHQWVAPNGHKLSDSIWRVDLRTRMRIDQLVADGVRQGLSAEQLAKRLSGSVRPDSYATSTVNGVNISYDALRLARTAIAAASGQATIAATAMNPVALGVDWVVSARHEGFDECDKAATIDQNGKRIKPPYAPSRVPTYPNHPNDLCKLEAAFAGKTSDAARELTRQYASGEAAPFTPAALGFTAALMGGGQ